MKKYIASIIFLFLGYASIAQNNTLYFMDAVPQSRMNPAVKSTNTWYMGVPMLSAFQFSLATPFVITDFVSKKDNKLTINVNDFIDQVDNKNRMNFNMMMSPIAFGFHTNDMFFDVSFNLKNDFRFSMPGDLFKLAHEGNKNFLGKTIDLSPTWVNAQSYYEIAFGANRKITDELTVGVRPKLIFGVANARLKFDEFGIHTDANTSEMNFVMDGSARSSLALDVETDDEGYITDVTVPDQTASDFIFKNTGFGIDLGAHYQFTDQIEFEASLVDLGFINWSNPTTFESKGEYLFKGIEYDADDDDFDIGESFTDTLKSTFKVATSSGDSYKTSLTTKLLLAARYKVNDQLKVGALVRNRFYNSTMHPAFTLSANYQPFKIIGLTGTYSMADGGFANFGAGLNINLGAFQLYAVTDNIKGLLLPHKSSFASLQFGMNLTFGFMKKEKPEVEEPEPKKQNEGEVAPVF